MDTPQDGSYLLTFERIEEYKAILESVDQLALRRQNINTVYMGLNTVFLSALGLFISTHINFTVWSTAIGVTIIALAILPLNIAWRSALRRYDGFSTLRYNYLRDIEREFRARRGNGGQSEIGLFLRTEKQELARIGNSRVEHFLAWWFVCFYPGAAVVAFLLAGLVQSHIIAPPTLP